MTDKPGNNGDAWREDESTVSRAYGELQRPGPPPRLDEKILAEARRAVKKQDNVLVRVHNWRRWTMPAALAATVVFAVPLVVRVFDTMSTDLEAVHTPATSLSEKASGQTTQADADRDSAAPPTPVFATENQLAPATAPPAAARSLLPSTEQSDAQMPATGQLLVETRRTERSSTAADRPEADSVSGARAPEPAASAEVFAAAPPRDAERPGAFIDDADDAAIAPKMAPKPRFQAREVAQAASYREKGARADGQQAGEFEQDDSRYARTGPAAASDSIEMAFSDEEAAGSTGLREPQRWLDDIAGQHRRALFRTARLELGAFLKAYPDYPLPDDYPLQTEDALYDDEAANIAPEAAAWLRGIGLMAEGGEIDEARTELAEFFRIYPDYRLPEGFPLTRDDARPIER